VQCAVSPEAEGESDREGPDTQFGDIARWRELVEHYGSDAVRLYFLGLGPASRRASFRARTLRSLRRFLNRVWRESVLRIEKGQFVSRRVLVQKHRMIYEVANRVRRMRFHTAVASIRKFVNFLCAGETTPEEMNRESIEMFLVVLSPFAPHLAQELWEKIGNEGSVLDAPWPEYSEELVAPAEREVAIFVDGRLIDKMVQPSDLSAEKLESRALQRDRIRRVVGTAPVGKVVAVPGKVVSIVTGDAKSGAPAD
jgi:leucyl-tRNA synthetase